MNERLKDFVMVKKRLIIIFIVCVVFIIICIGAGKYPKRAEYKEISNYVSDNQGLLTKYAQKLYEDQQEELHIYDKFWELLVSKDSFSINRALRIDTIIIYKKFYYNEEYVKFYMNYKPQSQEYYSCGIYYSPKNVTLDYYRNIQPEDVYEFDGTPLGTRIRYRSEKICDYWYYFEEAVWN